MKRIIGFVPKYTITLIVIMYIGMYYGHADYSWASTPNKWFTMSNVKALFGHVGMKHFFTNAITYALFAIPAEICLGSKKYFKLQTVMIIVYLMVDVSMTNLTHMGPSMGASGWVGMSIGTMVYGAAYAMDKHQGNLGVMLLPMMTYIIMCFIAHDDMVRIGSNDGIGHMAHVVGFLMGTILMLGATPFVYRAAKRDWREYQRLRYWAKMDRLNA